MLNIHKSINVIYHINGLKPRNCLVTPIDTEKAFDEKQQLFMAEVMGS